VEERPVRPRLVDQLAPRREQRVAQPQEGEGRLQKDVRGDQRHQLRDEHRDDPRDEVMEDDPPAAGAVGARRLDIGRLLDLQEHRAIGLDPRAKDAEEDDAAEDHPDAPAVQRAHHDQDGQEREDHVQLRDALDERVRPAPAPHAHRGDEHRRHRGAQRRQEAEGQRHRRAPQERYRQVAPAMVRAGHAGHLPVHHQFGIHAGILLEQVDVHDHLVVALERLLRRALGIREQPDLRRDALQPALQALVEHGPERPGVLDGHIPQADVAAVGRQPAEGGVRGRRLIVGRHKDDHILRVAVVRPVDREGEGDAGAVAVRDSGDAGGGAVQDDRARQGLPVEPVHPYRVGVLGILCPDLLAAAPQADRLRVGDGCQRVDGQRHQGRNDHQPRRGRRVAPQVAQGTADHVHAVSLPPPILTRGSTRA